MLNAYIFMDDETATLFNTPVLQVPTDTTELTIEQIRKIFLDQFSSYSNIKITEDECKNWSKEKLGQAMWDVHCLMFDSVALVPLEYQSMLKLLGDDLFDDFGGDSSTYAACKHFNTVLKGLAVRVINFPTADCDLYYKDIDVDIDGR